MGSPLVSVVVPVFNGAEHLEECLESVLAQTYGHWDGVVINNCSTDRTGEIAEGICRRDKRLRVIHCNEFLSQSENYNRALAHVSPEARYVKMVEADNWMMPDCLQRMVLTAEADERIGAVGCYQLHGRKLEGEGLPVKTQVVDGPTACRLHLVEDVYFFGCPTTLLFRAEALRAVPPAFRSGLFHDDVDLCFRLLRTWKFGFVHQVLVFVREDNAGLFSRFSDFGYRLPTLWLLAGHYGATYLHPVEDQKVIADIENRYQRQLGRALLAGRSRAYWDFHRDVFKLRNRKLSRWKLVWPAALAALDLLLNPKSTCERLWNRVHLER